MPIESPVYTQGRLQFCTFGTYIGFVSHNSNNIANNSCKA